jgi:hypothetical protein
MSSAIELMSACDATSLLISNSHSSVVGIRGSV